MTTEMKAWAKKRGPVSLAEIAFEYRNSLMSELGWDLDKANARAINAYKLTEDEMMLFDALTARMTA